MTGSMVFNRKPTSYPWDSNLFLWRRDLAPVCIKCSSLVMWVHCQRSDPLLSRRINSELTVWDCHSLVLRGNRLVALLLCSSLCWQCHPSHIWDPDHLWDVCVLLVSLPSFSLFLLLISSCWLCRMWFCSFVAWLRYAVSVFLNVTLSIFSSYFSQCFYFST